MVRKVMFIKLRKLLKVRKLVLAQSLSKNIDKNLYILADVKKEIKTKEFNNFC